MSQAGNLMIFDDEPTTSGSPRDGAVGGSSLNNTLNGRENLGNSRHKTESFVDRDTRRLIDTISGSDEGSEKKLAGTFDGLDAGIVIHFFEDDLKKIDSDYGGLTSRQPSIGQVQQVEIKCDASKNSAQIKQCVDEIKRKISNSFTKDSVAFKDKYSLAKDFIFDNQGNRKVLFYLSKTDGLVHITGPVYQDVTSGKHQLNVHLGFTKTTQRSRTYARVASIDQELTNKPEQPQLQRSLSHESGKKSSFSSSSSSHRRGKFDFTEELRGGVVLRVYKASIVKVDVDVIVNAANDFMAHGGGVARAIADAAGYSLTQESKDYIDKHQRIPVTENCVTTAGRLEYKGVIHAVGPQWYMYRDKLKCVKDVYDTVWNIFETCGRRGYSTVAVPAISAGIYAVPKTLCTDMYIKACVDFSSKGSKSLREVHFVDVDEEILKQIKSSFEKWKDDSKSIDPELIVSKYLKINPSAEPWGGQGQGQYGGRGRRGQRNFVSDNRDENMESDDRWKGNKSSHVTSSWDNTGHSSICKVTTGPSIKIGQGIIADTFKINDKVTVKVYAGSIEKVSTVGAVVSSADKELKPTGFIADALKKAGGKSYEKAVKDMRKDVYPKTLQTGECSVSEGGFLKVEKVIHLVSKRVSNRTDIPVFKTGMANVLTEADTNHIGSIALPLLGTGMLSDKEGLFSEFCEAFVQTICEFYAKNPIPTLKEIHLVNHADPVCGALNKAFHAEIKKTPQNFESSIRSRPLPAVPSNNSASSPMEVDVDDDDEEEDPLYDTVYPVSSNQGSVNSQWRRRESKQEVSEDNESDEDKNGGCDKTRKTEAKGNLVIID